MSIRPNRLMTRTLRSAPWGGRVARILAAALDAVEPRAAVSRALQLEGDALLAGGHRYDLAQFDRLLVVGAGKAGLPMAQGLFDLLGERITAGQLTTKDGHAEGRDALGPIRIAEAAHPLPDERAVAATQSILALLSATTERDLVIALISGGGSALLTAPVPGLTLADLRALTAALLARGATINEVNALRKQFDQVKGGGLARAAAPAQVLTLILSDVVGDPLDVIASGPTVPNPDTPAEVLSLIDRYDLADLVPGDLRQRLAAQPAGDHSEFSHVHNLLVGNNELAARAALAAAEREGFHSRLLTTTLEGEACQIGLEMAAVLRRLAEDNDPLPRPACLIAGGETTVTLRGAGLGGRNQELALAAVAPLGGLPDAALLTLATDGGDGPTDAAGALVTGDTLARARALDLDPADYLARNDAYAFFDPLGDLLKPGPTRTNVNDLLFLFIL